jgi:DNA polymerase family A
MSLLPFMEDIAIRAGGQQLMLPACLQESEIATVIECKAEILRDLRAHQMTAAGFLTRLPGSLLHEIQAAPWLVVDVETSALTRYSVPERITKDTTIGQGNWTAYLADNQDATLDVRPRVRVLTVHHARLGTYAWDLDALSQQQREQLFSAVVRNKILIGHNVGFDLSWLFGETEARPSMVLDTMMLMRQIRPGTLLRLFGWAAKGDEAKKKQAVEMIQAEGGRVSAKLIYIAACLGMPVPDKTYQKPQNWCVTPLSGQHHRYVAGDVDLPMQILRFLLPNIDVEEMPATIERKYPWYCPFAAATIRLAEAHVRGVPFNFEAADELKAESLVELKQTVDELVQIPEYAALSRETLVDQETGETQAMTLALAAHAELHGIVLPKTDTGEISTNRKALMLTGASKLPAWPPYERLKAAKKAIGVLQDYKRAASVDGRLHSIITCSTTTGRMTSSNPNLQNVPRDPRFRKLFQAKKDHVILAVDFNAIELRIAAGLASRAIDDIRARIKRDDTASWFMQQVFVGYHATTRLVSPPEPEPPWTLEWLREAIPATARTVLRRHKQTMASIFCLGLDPHLVTAIDMLRLRSAIDTGGLSSIDWLAAHDVEAREKLAEDWKAERQKAKAVNFGLLYGMGAIGLHRSGITDFEVEWTLEEATRARNAWFDLFPELRLWHFWTKYIPSRKIEIDACVLWDSRKGELARPEYKPYVFEPTTLADRPFAILDGFKEARNYQDQGTGADILVRAIAMLPEDVAAMWILAVHDELLFEVPVDAIEEVRSTVVATMTLAGHEVLKGVIPIKVKAVDGSTWGKS